MLCQVLHLTQTSQKNMKTFLRGARLRRLDCAYIVGKKTAKLKELDANETIHGDENFNLFI